MMNELADDEKYLLLGKAAGTLSWEEKIAVSKLFQTNPSAIAAWNELIAGMPDFEAEEKLITLNLQWNDLAAQFKRSDVKKSSYSGIRIVALKKYIIAASIIGILAASAIIWKTFLNPFQRKIFSSKNPGIELKLANGKIINLTQNKGLIKEGNTNISNRNKTLILTLNNPGENINGVNTLTVPVGMDYKLKLADGTEVWLNSATKFEFPAEFIGPIRNVTVNGEAFFKVAKNIHKPFVVGLPKSNVQVLGTTFNINTYTPGTEKIALVEGQVEINSSKGHTKLLPGKEAVYENGKETRQETYNLKKVLSWQKGLFYFDNATLDEITIIIPRWYGVPVVIDNPSIRNRKFTGVINRNRPISVFLDDLQTISKIGSYIDKDGVPHFK